MDTIGKCQRQVFSLGVSQHMLKITRQDKQTNKEKKNGQTKTWQIDKQRQYGGWFDKPRLVAISLLTERVKK